MKILLGSLLQIWLRFKQYILLQSWKKLLPDIFQNHVQ